MRRQRLTRAPALCTVIGLTSLWGKGGGNGGRGAGKRETNQRRRKKKIYKWMGKTKRIGAEPDEKKVMKEDGGKGKKVKGTGGTGREKEGVMETWRWGLWKERNKGEQ